MANTPKDGGNEAPENIQIPHVPIYPHESEIPQQVRDMDAAKIRSLMDTAADDSDWYNNHGHAD